MMSLPQRIRPEHRGLSRHFLRLELLEDRCVPNASAAIATNGTAGVFYIKNDNGQDNAYYRPDVLYPGTATLIMQNVAQVSAGIDGSGNPVCYMIQNTSGGGSVWEWNSATLPPKPPTQIDSGPALQISASTLVPETVFIRYSDNDNGQTGTVKEYSRAANGVVTWTTVVSQFPYCNGLSASYYESPSGPGGSCFVHTAPAGGLGTAYYWSPVHALSMVDTNVVYMSGVQVGPDTFGHDYPDRAFLVYLNQYPNNQIKMVDGANSSLNVSVPAQAQIIQFHQGSNATGYISAGFNITHPMPDEEDFYPSVFIAYSPNQNLQYYVTQESANNGWTSLGLATHYADEIDASHTIGFTNQPHQVFALQPNDSAGDDLYYDYYIGNVLQPPVHVDYPVVVGDLVAPPPSSPMKSPLGPTTGAQSLASQASTAGVDSTLSSLQANGQASSSATASSYSARAHIRAEQDAIDAVLASEMWLLLDSSL